MKGCFCHSDVRAGVQTSRPGLARMHGHGEYRVSYIWRNENISPRFSRWLGQAFNLMAILEFVERTLVVSPLTSNRVYCAASKIAFMYVTALLDHLKHTCKFDIAMKITSA